MRRLILLFWFLTLSLDTKAQPLSCSPMTIQTSCSAQELRPAQTSNELSLPLHAFNPIHLQTGNKHLKEIDYLPHPKAPDLEIVRYYHSMNSSYNLFGLHWLLSYDIKLVKTANHHVLRLPQGSELVLNSAMGQLQQSNQHSLWQTTQGEQWIFDEQGWLQSLYHPQRPPLHIHRHPSGTLKHRIDYIEQNQQRLQLHYNSAQPALVRAIETPVGTIHYHYESSPNSSLYQLERLGFPDQRQLHYHYEPIYQANNSGLITGKSIQLNAHSPLQRVRSWVYNAQKQAIFMMAEHPSHWIRLHYPNPLHPQQTHLISPQGLTSIEFTAQSPIAIKQVQGALCWACPPLLTQTAQHIQLQHATISRQLDWLEGDFLGWPQLRLQYDTQQRLSAWSTQHIQPTTLQYDDQGRAQHMRFANGDTQSVHYTDPHEVSHINYYSAQQAWQTRLQRPHPQQLHIQHPTEDETLHYTPTGQLRSRQIQRRFQPPQHNTTHQWHYQEHFEYDAQHRLIHHRLPEGGSLHYHWKQQQLDSITWTNEAGLTQPVAQHISGGLRFGNGLVRLEYATPALHWLAWGQTERLWGQQLLLKNPQGLIGLQRQQSHHAHDSAPLQHHLSYNKNQQIEAIYAPTTTQQFAWENDGNLRSFNQLTGPHIERDASGLARSYKNAAQHYILRYNPLRRLDVVLDGQKIRQKNQHNSAGFRVYAQHYPQATQQLFLYHDKKLVAEFSAPFEAKLPIHAAHPVSRRYIYWHDHPIALIDYQNQSQGELLVIHSDHLGAAHAISDAQQRLRWQASYDVFGAAHHIVGDIDFHLRRSGQYYDLATGWHDNLLRTYLPESGQYLEPDPLGPNPSSQLYGYARQQPLNHTDPWGLLLFAFDGTRYDERSGGVVHQLHQLSADHSFYQAGPGQADELTWDAMVAYSADRIVQHHWHNLLNYLQNQPQTTTPIPIDIIGFSRGAALARHFANQIIQHTHNGLFSTTDSYGQHIQACIQPRFMGLLDSVAQIGILGSRNHLYDFSVAPLWQWVGHAVALHEYRSLFPALLIGSGTNREEIGLVGAHGDLGGGYASMNESTQPLSHVSLHWLLWQAKAQGLSFHTPTLAPSTTSYLHDESSPLAQDRTIEHLDPPFFSGIGISQSAHPTLGRQARQQVQAFLSFELNEAERIHNQKAKVDLNAYYRWLDQTLNWSPH